MRLRVLLLVFFAVCYILRPALAEERLLDAKLHHLRIEGEREWAEFPEAAESASLSIHFQGTKNRTEFAIRLRHQDVKQSWQVVLNDKELGRLLRDENDMVVYFPVPEASLRDGVNLLEIRQIGRQIPDDIRVGEISLFDRPQNEVLTEGMVEVEVFDAQSRKHIPCRITVLDSHGAMATVGAQSSDHLAVRPGTIYSSTGKATFGLPRGEYTIYAGRGFEWGLDEKKIVVDPAKPFRLAMSISHEVPTPGYVSCDPHVHTYTHSRHGDATIQERMITLAGEGIELPIATDHNLNIDYEATAKKMGVRQYFTPVIGNEVSTKIGHFNVFPISTGAAVPNQKLSNWKSIFQSIYDTPKVRAVILNHARDIHGGFRPFGPEHHNAVVGQNLDGWQLQANAMELINSGAVQTDPMQPVRDWMAMLNRGIFLTPVGSSDSHDVSRHFVGQGRTYIRCDDSNPGNIDIDQAVNNFVAGRVNVCYGLLTEIQIDGKYGPGDLVRQKEKLIVDIRVLGPSWASPKQVELYANGRLIRSESIPDQQKSGVKYRRQWVLEKFHHDVHLVAIARGPGVKELAWAMAKPYQPTSVDWESKVFGISGAVWIDADGDGRRTCAFENAKRLYQAAEGDLRRVIESLAPYDEAVAAQVASILNDQGISPLSDDLVAALKKATPVAKQGFQAYTEAWRLCQMAR